MFDDPFPASPSHDHNHENCNHDHGECDHEEVEEEEDNVTMVLSSAAKIIAKQNE